MPFDPPALETDPEAVTLRILDGLADRLDGWVAVEGDPIVALAEEIGREIAEMNQVTQQWLSLAVAAMGETAFQFPSYGGATASISVDLTLNAANVVIPAGFTVVGLSPNGEAVAFVLPADAGSTTTTKRVTMTAAEVGDFANGVPAGPLQIMSATTMVTAATAAAASTNGADPEQIDAYLDRLVDFLSTLRPGGVTGDDLASLARSVPGVYRALGVDLYDPGNPTLPSERTVTVFPVDSNGYPVSAAVKADLQARLGESREVNFVTHVADPIYTRVQIEFQVVPMVGADPVLALTEATVALKSWLARWGSIASDPQTWIAKNIVSYREATKIAGSAAGVAYVAALTINGIANDAVLQGPAALPSPLDHPTVPSTVTGVVVE